MENSSQITIEVRSNSRFSLFQSSLSLYSLALGGKPVGLYLFLTTLVGAKPQSLSELLAKISYGAFEFSMAQKMLEVAGLLKTYEGKISSLKTHRIYELFPPLSEEEFAKDPILTSLYKENTHEEISLKETSVDSSIFNEVTSSYQDLFPNKEIREIFNTPRVELNKTRYFDRSLFKDALEEKGTIDINQLSEKELKRIEQAAKLYGLSEDVFAELLDGAFDSKKKLGYRIDFLKYLEKCREASKLSLLKKEEEESKKPLSPKEEALKKLETYKSSEYLKSLQKTKSLARGDATLLKHLKDDFNLEDSVLNVLILFTLQRHNMQLPAPYMEKVAASLKRADVHDVNGALNYLNKTSRKAKQSKAQEDYVIEDENLPSLEELIGELMS